MGFLSGLFKSRDAPKDSTAGSTYRFHFGGSTSGKLVTERSSMQMTAVYAFVRVLAEAVAVSRIKINLMNLRKNAAGNGGLCK